MSSDSEQILALSQATRAFGGLEVLKATTLAVCPGDYLAIMGESGSGKSTLLNLMGLLDRPSTGQISVHGQEVSKVSDAARSAIRGQTVGFVFQAFHLLSSRKVVDNVELGMLYRAIPSAERCQRALESLHRVGLSHRLTAYPNTLSGGERQRVAIARAVAADVDVLLADEPTGNLDSATGERVLELIDELHDSGLAIVMVTHSREVAERADRVLVMTDGRIHG